MTCKMWFRSNIGSIGFCVFLFTVAFISGPVWQLDFLASMPGDHVDARLNLFFLENIYAHLLGLAGSLIHLNIFYPYPYVSAFSDNLLGSAPIYLIARLSNFTPESAFQFWFLFGYVINFIAAVVSLRIFGQTLQASALGAILFTYGLPVSAQMGHAQLQYRFGLALAIAYFYLFLTAYNWRAFLASAFWLVWQFLCSIYLGFFTSVFMLAMIIFLPLRYRYLKKNNPFSFLFETINFFQINFQKLQRHERIYVVGGGVILALALISLFYPYLMVTRLYKFTRAWVEISVMLPRISSYFMADHSLIWGDVSRLFDGSPVRWEQQLFIGLVPTSIYVAHICRSFKFSLNVSRLAWIGAAVVALIIMTLNISDYSLWRLVIGLPLFSAIRAVSRIVLLFIFPFSLFMSVAIDEFSRNKLLKQEYLIALISVILLIEVSAVDPLTSSKYSWITLSNAEERRVPAYLPENPIIFFSQRSSFFEREEVDAMMVAQKKSLPTLNGYSGSLPHHFRAIYGNDCGELPRRILLYLNFLGSAQDKITYAQLASRVVPIGFLGCKERWRSVAPMTISDKVLDREQLSRLSLSSDGILKPLLEREQDGSAQEYLSVRIHNNSNKNISAISAVDRPLRIAWREDTLADPTNSWRTQSKTISLKDLMFKYRRDLPEDIPANGYVEILVPIAESLSRSHRALEFTIVQEDTLWGLPVDLGNNIWGEEVGVKSLRVEVAGQ